MSHKWVSWRYMELNGRIRKRAIEHPRRERLLVRVALESMGLRYMEAVPVINRYWGGWRGELEASVQWLDFCVWTGKRMIVLLFEPKYPNHGMKKHEEEAFEAKKWLLEELGRPYLVLSRTETSADYRTRLENLLHKRK